MPLQEYIEKHGLQVRNSISKHHLDRMGFLSGIPSQPHAAFGSLQKKVEEALNACVKAKPEEPLSFMVGT